MKKVKFFMFITFGIIVVLFTLFFVRGKIKTYDKCIYWIVDESNIDNEITKKLSVEESDEYLSSVIKILDFSREGILSEYINVNAYTGGVLNVPRLKDRLNNSVYAVLYNDKTIKYIRGYLDLFSHRGGTYQNVKISDDEVIDTNSEVLFINSDDVMEEKTIKLSSKQYYNLLVKLMALKFIDKGEEEFPYENQYVTGFCLGERHYNIPTYIKNNLRDILIRNLANNFRECIGMEDV